MRVVILAVVALIGLGAATRPAGLRIDGRELPAERRFPARDAVLAYAPGAEQVDAAGKLVIEDLTASNLTNQRAIDVALWSAKGVIRQVVIRRCEISGVRRDETGTKLDARVQAVRIWGEGEQQTVETDVVMEDVTISGGDVLPVLLQEGRFGTITLRRVKVRDATGPPVQVSAINGGSVKKLVVEECPGLKVDLIGSRGSIGECVVRASVGAEVRDVDGRSGAKVVHEKGAAVAKGEGPRLLVSAGTKGKTVVLKLEGVGTDVAAVTFEAFTPHGYRMGLPVVATEAPWQAEIAVNRPGKVTGRATVTRSGGDVQKELEGTVDVGAE